MYFQNAEETSCSALAVVCLELCQTPKMEFFAKIVNG